ncbi:MAG: RNA methyltransferase [Thermoflexales bacterium]|nr:RNA methyltransferase [Thermoflexales bacterium]MDW8352491.1 RNA methyltransferase [Anaerolineae bacterium]
MRITSLTNPRVKHIVALREKRQRDEDGLMLVEGFDPLVLALDCGVRPQAVFICPELFKPARSPNAHANLQWRIRDTGAEVIETTRPVFEKMAYRDGPDGWLAVVKRPDFSLGRLPEAREGASPLYLVAEAVEKPGNLGAMLRTCDAAGVHAFLFCDPKADLTNPNVVRASQGALFSVPVAQCASAEAIAWLRARGVRIVATTPNPLHGRWPMSYTQFDFTQPCAIAVGEEKYGLSGIWIDQADAAVRIPMFGRINSLNVATSAALVIYEAIKQRGLT